jgi:hypothetical protein
LAENPAVNAAPEAASIAGPVGKDSLNHQPSATKETTNAARLTIASTGPRMPLGQRLDQQILGQLAVLVELVGRADPLHLAHNAVAVAEAAEGLPHTTTKVAARDVAVLSNSQPWSTRHRWP